MGPGRTFGQVLKQFRREAELTQEELAEAARLSVRAIQALESGASHSPRADTLALLSAALGLTPEQQAAFAAAARYVASPEAIAADGRRTAAADLAPAPLVPLIGREAEVALLERHLSAGAPSGDAPQLLLLAGEPGIGKSRLLREAVQRGVAHGFAVLSGGCHRRGGQDPYAPLLDALLQHIQGHSVTRARADLAGCAWLVRLLPEATELLEPLPAVTLDPRQERRLMFAAVARYLATVAGPAGTLLVLDDLQWAGPDALDLLSTLLRSAAQGGGASRGTRHSPLRVVAAYRDTEVGPADPLGLLAADLTLAGVARLHQLRPLAAEDAATLLGTLLVGRTASERAVATHVLERAGGVPFFLVSYARAWQEGNAHAVPADLAQGVRQRVALLPPAGAEILAAAAIVGRRVPHALLVRVAQMPEEAVLAGVDAACQARLLLEEGDDAYSFAHDVIREVVEADLGAARRALLHRTVAAALEAQLGEPAIEALAYHYGQGGRLEKAAAYLEQAGDQAWAQRAHGAAEGHYRAALDGLERLGRTSDALRVREKLGEVLQGAGRYDAALEVLEQAAETYGAGGDLAGQARVTAAMGWAHALRGTPARGIALITALLERLERGDAVPPPLAALYEALAYLHFTDGQYDASLAAGDRAAALARADGDERTLAYAEAHRINLLQMLGRLGEALRVGQEMLPLAERVGDLICLVGAHSDVAYIHALQGAFASSRRSLDRALAWAEQAGNPGRLTYALAMRGWVAALSGEWTSARADLERAASVGSQISRSWFSAYLLIFQARLSLTEGAWEAAAAQAQEALALGEASGDLQARRWAATTLAESEILQGRPEAARARLAALLDRPGMQECDVTLLLPVLAWAQLDLGQVDEAAHTVQQALQRARPEGMRPTLVEALRVQALIALRRGHVDTAITSLEEGLALARAMPYPDAEARLLQVAARLRAPRGAAERAVPVPDHVAGRAPAHAATVGVAAEPERPAAGTQQAGLGTAPRAPAEDGPALRGGSAQERAAWVLNYLRTVGAISPGRYATALGVDRRTARRDLQALAARGLIVARGTTRDRRYMRPTAEP